MNRWELLASASMLVTIFLPIVFVFVGAETRAAQEKARARRMAEHRMNARLLRLDI